MERIPLGVLRNEAGMIFGVASFGGDLSGCGGGGCGVVYALDPSGHQSVLYTFTGRRRWRITGRLIPGDAGNLYGRTFSGGNLNECGGSGCGVVFQVNVSAKSEKGVCTTLRAEPTAPTLETLILDDVGNIYGATYGGGNLSDCGGSGCGVFYKLNTSGQLIVVYTFLGGNDGSGPNSPVYDGAGSFYGTTGGGGPQGLGTIYKLTSGQETQLYVFNGNTGGNSPNSGVILDTQGNLYGTTIYGGTYNQGVAYTFNGSGKEVVLHEFAGSYTTVSQDGANPWALIRDPQGNLYGTTPNGGNPIYFGGCGVVYKIDPSGDETVLHTFTASPDGCGAGSLVLDSAGNLYGTSQFGGIQSSNCSLFGCGVVFKLDPFGNETILYSYTGGADSTVPGALVRDSAGNLYVNSSFGGSGGAVLKIDTALNPTILHSFTGGADGGGPGSLIRDEAGQPLRHDLLRRRFQFRRHLQNRCLRNFQCVVRLHRRERRRPPRRFGPRPCRHHIRNVCWRGLRPRRGLQDGYFEQSDRVVQLHRRSRCRLTCGESDPLPRKQTNWRHQQRRSAWRRSGLQSRHSIVGQALRLRAGSQPAHPFTIRNRSHPEL